MWGWISRNDTQLKILLAVIAAAYTALEYRDRVEATEVERTLEFTKRYGEGGVLESATTLSQFWVGDGASALRSSKTLADYSSRLISALEREQVVVSVHHLLGFFRGLSICTTSGICDAESACGFFFSDVQAFRESYRPLVKRWQRQFG